jgi:hypothetical protein
MIYCYYVLTVIFNPFRYDILESGNHHIVQNLDKMDLARQTVDEAIGRIRQEVEMQREKSNSMCRLRTAHNWYFILSTYFHFIHK